MNFRLEKMGGLRTIIIVIVASPKTIPKKYEEDEKKTIRKKPRNKEKST